ncbi:MAG: cupin domain-containing protein [Kiloniellales bacterium]
MPGNRFSSDAAAIETVYTRRAIYVTPTKNAFEAKLPKVPAHVFLAERDRALDPATGTALIDLDLRPRLETGFPATTPNLMARYVRIRGGDDVSFDLKASGEAYYVIAGAGVARKGDDRIDWRSGDVFCLPGGGETALGCEDGDGVLFQVTDEPALAYHRAEPPAPGRSQVQVVHYPSAEILRQLAEVQARMDDGKVTGRAVLFTSAGVHATQTATTTIALAMNSLKAGGVQVPHRHNAAALTLCVQGDQVYSMIEGRRVDWRKDAVMVTPPAALHSHHNEGDDMMLSIVAQDGGLFYHARAVGFSWD